MPCRQMASPFSLRFMPLPLIPIAVELLRKLGPTLLRKFGKSHGGTTEVVAGSVADVMEGVRDEPEAQQQAAIAEALKGLSPEQAVAFSSLQVELERVKQEGVWKDLEIQLEQVKQDGAARVAELAQTDVYTKRTRPLIARQSWYVAATYALGCHVALPLIAALYKIPPLLITFDWSVFLALCAPAMTYTGVRGFEKWKHGDKIS